MGATLVTGTALGHSEQSACLTARIRRSRFNLVPGKHRPTQPATSTCMVISSGGRALKQALRITKQLVSPLGANWQSSELSDSSLESGNLQVPYEIYLPVMRVK